MPPPSLSAGSRGCGRVPRRRPQLCKACVLRGGAWCMCLSCWPLCTGVSLVLQSISRDDRWAHKSRATSKQWTEIINQLRTLVQSGVAGKETELTAMITAMEELKDASVSEGPHVVYIWSHPRPACPGPECPGAYSAKSSASTRGFPIFPGRSADATTACVVCARGVPVIPLVSRLGCQTVAAL